MRTKLKIVMCALFVLGLAVSQVHAQVNEAYTLGATHRQIAQYGHNQMVGTVVLRHVPNSTSDTDVAVPTNGKLEFSFGGLAITNGSITAMCDTDLDLDTGFTADCDGTSGHPDVDVDIAEDKKKLTLTIPSNDRAGSNIRFAGNQTERFGSGCRR